MSVRYIKWGAVGAIAYPILQLISQALIQLGGAEPAFSAPSQEILTFFQSKNSALVSAAGYINVLSVIAFLWFVGVLGRELFYAERQPSWISVIAVGSGLVAASQLLDAGGWGLAFFRVNEGLDPQIARTLFDGGNLNFANLWVSLGSSLLAAGVVFRAASRDISITYPRWMAGGSIMLGTGLILARAVWTSQIAFAPYVLFWVWIIAFGVYVLRRPAQGS